jgi:hypothetical protein
LGIKHGRRGTKANPIEGEHQLFGFLTTDANAEVGAIHLSLKRQL